MIGNMGTEVNEMKGKFRELTDEELMNVTGGNTIGDVLNDITSRTKDCKSLPIGVDICSLDWEYMDDEDKDYHCSEMKKLDMSIFMIYVQGGQCKL